MVAAKAGPLLLVPSNRRGVYCVLLYVSFLECHRRTDACYPIRPGSANGSLINTWYGIPLRYGTVVHTSCRSSFNRLKLRPPRMPHAIWLPECHIVASYLPPWTNCLLQWKRVWHSQFIQGLGLALVPKTCPRRPQAFNKVNNGQGFPKNIFQKVLNEPIAGTPMHVCKGFHAHIRSLTA